MRGSRLFHQWLFTEALGTICTVREIELGRARVLPATAPGPWGSCPQAVIMWGHKVGD